MFLRCVPYLLDKDRVLSVRFGVTRTATWPGTVVQELKAVGIIRDVSSCVPTLQYNNQAGYSRSTILHDMQFVNSDSHSFLLTLDFQCAE